MERSGHHFPEMYFYDRVKISLLPLICSYDRLTGKASNAIPIITDVHGLLSNAMLTHFLNAKKVL